jgi:hypothetical protein
MRKQLSKGIKRNRHRKHYSDLVWTGKQSNKDFNKLRNSTLNVSIFSQATKVLYQLGRLLALSVSLAWTWVR